MSVTDTCRMPIVGNEQGICMDAVKYGGSGEGIVDASDFSSPPLKREPGSASPALSILLDFGLLVEVVEK